MKQKVNMFRNYNINDLTIYVAKKCENIVKKRNLENYIQDQFDDSIVYNQGTNEVVINNNINTK